MIDVSCKHCRQTHKCKVNCNIRCWDKEKQYTQIMRVLITQLALILFFFLCIYDLWSLFVFLNLSFEFLIVCISIYIYKSLHVDIKYLDRKNAIVIMVQLLCDSTFYYYYCIIFILFLTFVRPRPVLSLFFHVRLQLRLRETSSQNLN